MSRREEGSSGECSVICNYNGIRSLLTDSNVYM